MYPLEKTQVALNLESAAQKQVKTVLQEGVSDTSYDDSIPLAKLVSNGWSDCDGDAPLSVLRQTKFLTKRGGRFEILAYKKCSFPGYCTKKKSCLIGDGSCDF